VDRRRSLVWWIPLFLGCSSEPRVLNIEIVTGHESDAMTQEPAVANVVVQGQSPEGEVIQAEAAPGGALDFGEVDGDLLYNFEVTGFDGAGNAVMRGTSLGIVLNSVGGDTFQIFAQRLGAWARPPGQLARTHTRAPAVSVGERYLLMTGGDSSEDALAIEQYDLAAWAGIDVEETLPFAARTLILQGASDDTDLVVALGSDEANEVASFQLGKPPNSNIELPEGLTSFGELAGGTVVVSDDGRIFVVGATRLSSPTDAVLEITAEGDLVVYRLVHERAGAAAEWLDNLGLVVIGGTADGPGVEVLGEKATTFVVHGFPPDATIGADVVKPQELPNFVLVGGTVAGAPAKTRVVDPRCTSDCSAEDRDLATPSTPLTRVSAYPLGQGRLVAVGDELDPSGLTRTFMVDYGQETVTELPLREPRRWATPIPTPNGKLAVMGGVHPDGTPALTVEMLVPE
jgi:hypothetical protein